MTRWNFLVHTYGLCQSLENGPIWDLKWCKMSFSPGLNVFEFGQSAYFF